MFHHETRFYFLFELSSRKNPIMVTFNFSMGSQVVWKPVGIESSTKTIPHPRVDHQSSEVTDPTAGCCLQSWQANSLSCTALVCLSIALSPRRGKLDTATSRARARAAGIPAFRCAISSRPCGATHNRCVRALRYRQWPPRRSKILITPRGAFSTART